jgi:hypothetical protein
MSSTTGIQNLLVNVFRPVYTYDPINPLFTPKLSISNIDAYSGNTISVFNAAVGDTAGNVYVGSNAGNSYTTIRSCSNNTTLGYGAGFAISNVSNSTYIGFNTGAATSNASNVIGIGTNTGGAGISNIFLGNGTSSIGSNNISIGHGIVGGTTSNVFLGNGTSATGSNNILIGHGISGGSSSSKFQVASTLYGNLLTNWIGIGTTTPYDPNDKLDVSGNMYLLGQIGVNITPGDRTLDVNGDFRAADASGNILDFNDGVTLSSGGLGSVQSNVSAAVGTTTIGQIKKGIIHVSAVDRASSANRAAYIYFAWTTSNVTSLASSSNGDTDITTSTTNIQISNATTTKTYDYSITYFPLP